MRIHPPFLARNARRRGRSLSYEPLHQLNHETRKHATFTCSLPPSPCQTCKTHPSGRVYMFVASLILPIPSNTKNTPIWVCFSCSPPSLPLKHEQHDEEGMPPSHRVVSILTWREWVYPSSLCCHFNVARRGLSLLVVLCIFKATR